MPDRYYVYIMTNKLRTLYTGMTNNLKKRIHQHKNKLIDGFAKRYNIMRLVYFDVFDTALAAIKAEKRIKGWLRNRKIRLIESKNPTWRDLSENL